MDSPLKTLPRPAAKARANVAAGRGEGSRILVVDDHPVSRDVLVLQLELLGVAATLRRMGWMRWRHGRLAATPPCSPTSTCRTWMVMNWLDGCAPPKPIAAPSARRSLRSLPTP